MGSCGVQHMAAHRLRRTVTGVDYALFNNTGRKTGVFSSECSSEMADKDTEEGQIVDSPFDLHGDDGGEFQTNS